MRKRPSRRRIKARLWQGKWVPWCQIVDRDLQSAYSYERDHERMLARFSPPAMRSTTVWYDPKTYLITSGDVEFLLPGMDERRWAPL